VVEIGPGLGALTAPLLRRLDHLHVVEIDRDIIARLAKSYSTEQLTVHAGDALVFDFGRLASAAGGQLRIVGNLPYNISTPLLFHLAGFGTCVRDMHFMLQRKSSSAWSPSREAATFGRLSVMLQYRFVMERCSTCRPRRSIRRPRCTRRGAPDSASPGSLVGGERSSSSLRWSPLLSAQRRKMLRNSLRGMLDEAQLAALGVSPTCRAEELSVADYVRLANAMA
jgi:16S rRNA (adenine1518-N6/adenine1519-N6)-dimethyltransferase